MKALHRLKDELGITIILVTHFMDEAVNADRVIVMNDGKIALDGTPADVFSNSELLADIGLSVPKALELAVELRKNNIDIGGIPLTSDDFIKEYRKLCDELDEGTVIFDIPKNAPQGQAYEKSLVSKNVIGIEGAKVEIIIRPEARPASAPSRNNEITVKLTKEGLSINSAPAIQPVAFVEYLNERQALKQDTYAQLEYSTDVSLTDISGMAALISQLEVKELIKVEPPINQIYYKAFLPQDAWLKRSERLAQPLELHLTKQANAVGKKLIAIKEIWPDNSESINPILEQKEYDVSNAGTIKDVIVQAEAWKRDLSIDDSVFKNYIASGQAPLLVFAPIDLTIDELKHELEPFKLTHKNVFIFVGKKIID